MQKSFTKFLILTIILTAALSVNYLFAAWTGPTQAPPGGNTSTPIHIGSTNQVKDGGLSLDALSVFGGGYFQGDVEFVGKIKVGSSGNTPTAGEIRWTGADFQGYMGGDWVSLTGAGLACTSFTYSAWGECQSDSTQTRAVLTSSPAGCFWVNPITTQSCTPMSTQCENVGGDWQSGQKVCYINGASCPSGWSKKANYSSTQKVSCNRAPTGCNDSSCTMSEHTRENKGIESCSRPNGGWNWATNHCDMETVTCYATQTEIGCFKN